MLRSIGIYQLDQLQPQPLVLVQPLVQPPVGTCAGIGTWHIGGRVGVVRAQSSSSSIIGHRPSRISASSVHASSAHRPPPTSAWHVGGSLPCFSVRALMSSLANTAALFSRPFRRKFS